MWLEDTEREDSSLASFISCVEECVRERECRKIEEGLHIKVKLSTYRYDRTRFLSDRFNSVFT